jgi:hypothetical protein
VYAASQPARRPLLRTKSSFLNQGIAVCDRPLAMNVNCLMRRAVRSWNRSLSAIAIFGCWLAIIAPQPAASATLFALLYPQTGEIRLQNRDLVAPASLVFYSVASASGALNGAPSAWKSITETYDAPFGITPGNGFVDPNGEWIKLSATAKQLAEGALDADGGMIPSLRSISLGRIWNPIAAPIPDLIVSATALNGQPIEVSTIFAVDGDYLPDGVVNDFDYQLWRQFYGSTTALLADGNLNGIVDAADYAIWRNNRGTSVPNISVSASATAPPSALSAGTAIPEPPTASLVLLNALATFLGGGPRCIRLSLRERQRAIER